MAEVINMNAPGEFQAHVRRSSEKMRGAVKKAVFEVSQMCEKRARTYAPISPMQSQINRNMKMWSPLARGATMLVRKLTKPAKKKKKGKDGDKDKE